MRKKNTPALLLAALLPLCHGCAPSSPEPWSRAGTDEQTTARDIAECRKIARDEALRRYPHRAGSPSLGATGVVLSQQHDDNNRAIAEASFLNNCLQGRGYRRDSSGQ